MKNLPRLSRFWAYLLLAALATLLGLVLEALYSALGLDWPEILQRFVIGGLVLFAFVGFWRSWPMMLKLAAEWRYQRTVFYEIDQNISHLEQALLKADQQRRVILRQNQMVEAEYASVSDPSEKLKRAVASRRRYFQEKLLNLEEIEDEIGNQLQKFRDYKRELSTLQLMGQDPTDEQLGSYLEEIQELSRRMKTSLEYDLQLEAIEQIAALDQLPLEEGLF